MTTPSKPSPTSQSTTLPTGIDPTVQSLQKSGQPVTRASYLIAAGWTEPLDAELEATMPVEFRWKET